MNYIPEVLPKGTTLEQWQDYAKDAERHDEFIKNYKFFMDRMVTYLEWQGKRMNKASWTPSEIRDWVSSEISASSSCDAPNKPGYYRANND